MTGGKVTVNRARPNTMDAVLAKLVEAGTTIETTEDSITMASAQAAERRST